MASIIYHPGLISVTPAYLQGPATDCLTHTSRGKITIYNRIFIASYQFFPLLRREKGARPLFAGNGMSSDPPVITTEEVNLSVAEYKICLSKEAVLILNTRFHLYRSSSLSGSFADTFDTWNTDDAH